MKNGKKRRAWTSAQIRELKSMARRKAPAATRALDRQEPENSLFCIAAVKPRHPRARDFAFKIQPILNRDLGRSSRC
jgi:hypothetical protein